MYWLEDREYTPAARDHFIISFSCVVSALQSVGRTRSVFLASENPARKKLSGIVGKGK